jgi:hypothetical protein
MRTPNSQITLSTWTVRVDGQDVADVELDASDVAGVRDMVAAATGQRVSLGLTAHIRGTLADLIMPACDDFPCCGHAVTRTVRIGR